MAIPKILSKALVAKNAQRVMTIIEEQLLLGEHNGFQRAKNVRSHNNIRPNMHTRHVDYRLGK